MLKIDDLTVGYDGKPVLTDISCRMKRGKIYGVIGKNGSGKSTLLKACIGMLPAVQGEVLLNGKKLSMMPPLERSRIISYLTQHRNTPNITVERLVMHGRHPYVPSHGKLQEMDRIAMDNAMKEMNVYALRKCPLTSLSGGEIQRSYIAMLLAQDTPVMLLDEPTTYLDVEYQLRFFEYMKLLRNLEKTIVMVLHDLNHAFRYCDEIMLLEDGRIRKTGAPEELASSGAVSEVFRVKLDAVTHKGERELFISI